ncbi:MULTISPECIES: helix-turn-helix domain-containing protein [Streptomyces]|uniref:Transcriptional regulator n=4 Tax=Actinomycetes TaxID=1760 RepID=Q825C7_STRAW|nr:MULTISPECIES: helix-turn-helix transcriptional regulator [Streptomyces]MYT03065.1 helix-turn-helix domain-containing protein [Streptomyces sp. SID5469]BAC75242.1 putative transcriptional regulator [Streptomyces avermitilis MA-4680 = NBRC 14893]BAU77656.1 putative transcriptional regulator [Streptomyces avermitilis MA-4680 = NBRC 14893]GDY70326.1 transcriptional regulator [Streptomyces avermitilis]
MKPTGKDVDPQDRVFGQRVQKLRKEQRRTQAEFAAALGKTSSWMSQVERGIQPVQRMDLLQQIADELGVSVQQLRPSVADGSGPSQHPAPLSLSNDLDETRRLISGHPALRALLASPGTEGARSVEALRKDVDDLWELTHAARMAQVSVLAVELLPELERTARMAPDETRSELFLLLSRTYQALSAAFVRQDEADAAWVAADRAIFAAERSGDPLHVCAGVFRMTQAFVRLRSLGQAEHAARTAIDALEEQGGRSPQALSVLGSLHLALALVHARASARAEAKEEIAKARAIAAQLGENRNDFNLEFGPVNVEIQAVSTAVDLGDAGEALDIGLAIDAEGLSPERQGRLLMDLGRAHAQRRHGGEALDCLLRAEAVAPETIQTHQAARAAIRELVLVAGANASRDLLELAERADALD